MRPKNNPMKLCAVLLAAGASRRFGPDNKLLARLPDGQLLAQAAALPLVQTLEQVIAVVRPGEQQLAELLQQSGCQICWHERADAGMGSSLAKGVSAAANFDGWLVSLADMPYLRPSSVLQVADALRAGAAMARPIYHGKAGHPVGFSARFGPQLQALDDDHGARSIISAAPHLLQKIDCDDPAVLHDIDTLDDLAQLHQR